MVEFENLLSMCLDSICDCAEQWKYCYASLTCSSNFRLATRSRKASKFNMYIRQGQAEIIENLFLNMQHVSIII
jgi:hypothetical protein